jgi:serine/threonine-protein kinase
VDSDRPTDNMARLERDDEDTDTYTEQLLGPGTDVGGYLIDGELGHGGMGIVYSATHPMIGKRAAIKILRPELSRDPTAVERFINEARAVNQIGHPNIVDIFAFGTLGDGRSYYVMDLLEGESLRARIKRGPLHISEASSVIDEIASALIATHAKGIIHRDLKPDNIFMVSVPGRWPEVKLLDFGLAKLGALRAGKMRTLTGSVMGTPVYMSPEQARASESVDFRTDVYSLGVLAFELLTGAPPFKKKSSIDTLLSHAEDPVPAIVEQVPTVPVELAQLIEAMLAKTPDDRPTLTAIRAVLKRLKGTKIPTMTAAGLQMVLPGESMQFTPDPPTLNEFSGVVTQPRLPPPPAMPTVELELESSSVSLLPGNVPTLAGHSMPMPSQRPSQPSFPAPSDRPSQPFAVPTDRPSPPNLQVSTPYPIPYGSVPPALPMGFPSAAGLLRPSPRGPTEMAAPPRRWIVIAVVAVIASTIGIVIALIA